jgi:hypothetical protein
MATLQKHERCSYGLALLIGRLLRTMRPHDARNIVRAEGIEYPLDSRAREQTLMAVVENRRGPLRRALGIVRGRPRLFLAAALGLAAVAVLPTNWRFATRALVGWDIGAGIYLALAFTLMMNSDVNRIRRWAALQDEGRIVVLVLVVAAALASLGELCGVAAYCRLECARRSLSCISRRHQFAEYFVAG